MNIVDMEGCEYFNIRYYVNGYDKKTIPWKNLLAETPKAVNFAIKYGEAWMDLQEPFGDMEAEEFAGYINDNGIVVARSPFIWRVDHPEFLLMFLPSLFGSDECFAAFATTSLDLNEIRTLDADSAFLEVVNQSEYALTTLADYTGFIFVTKNEKTWQRQFAKRKDPVKGHMTTFIGNKRMC